MPNWATTEYAIEGPKEVLQKIEQAILHHPIKKDSSDSWEGNVLVALHDNPEWKPKTKRYLRGFIQESPEWTDDDSVLRFYAQEAWGATDFHTELEELFPDISVYYQVEEDNEGIYATNDREGKYFPDRYYLETCINGNYQYEYFIHINDALKWVEEISKRKLETWEDVDAFNERNERKGTDDSNYIIVHEYKIVDGK